MIIYQFAEFAQEMRGRENTESQRLGENLLEHSVAGPVSQRTLTATAVAAH